VSTSRVDSAKGFESQAAARHWARTPLRRAVHWRGPPRDPRLSVLIFHCVPRERDPLFPTESDAQSFERTLSLLRDCFRVMPLREAVAALRAGRLPSGALAITFDDGYADNATVALPIPKRLGLPATVFIAAVDVDGRRMFNDTVIEAVRAHEGEALDVTPLGLGIHATTSWNDRRAAIEAMIGKLRHLE
jgi:peptidoglycan/xylan/chitin deacetylase (PgdA/CDA1 family)